MIFQEPMTSLNPCFTVGFQIMETLKVHEGGTRAERRRRTVELLAQVGIPAPETRLSAFPHQMSGGMNQRVMIAMAIACNPRLLIADEPTTALDVTIQAQILDLLVALQRERGMALVLITHDMGVVAETAQRIMVMYASQQVEEQRAEQLFAQPRHPYTAALLEALPERSIGRAPLENHRRRRAGHRRSSGRLRVQSALRLCHRSLSSRAAETRGTRRLAGALSLPAERRPATGPSRTAQGGGGAMNQVLSLEAVDLHRYYQVGKRTVQAAGDAARRRRRQLHPGARQDARGCRRIRLRQVHLGAPHRHDRAADQRPAGDRRPGHTSERRGLRCARCARRCRWCSRIPTVR